MDCRLVVEEARSRRTEGVLHPGKPARRARDCELRPLPAANQDSAQGAQGRLALVRAQLLPPLPSGRTSCRAGRYVHQPRRISMSHSRREKVMPAKDRGTANTGTRDRTLDRRSILLGGTTITAASALVAGSPRWVAQAQAQAQPAPSGQRPNILVIWGDDVGLANVSAYSFGVMGIKTPNIDRIAREGLMFNE